MFQVNVYIFKIFDKLILDSNRLKSVISAKFICNNASCFYCNLVFLNIKVFYSAS